MIFKVLLAPDSPVWLLLTTVILSLIIVAGTAGWGAILEIRYTGPYTLIATPSSQKWRRAVILASLQTSFIPLIGLIGPILSPLPDQSPVFPLFCGGIWIIGLPITILCKRWNFEFQLKIYHKMDEWIRSGIYKRLFASQVFIFTRVFMTSELKRFLDEGFSGNLTE